MRLIGFGIVLVWAAGLTVFDVRDRRLPNMLTLPGAVAVLAVAFLDGRGLPALAGALGLAALYLVVHLAIPAGLGAGDVKLALGVGGLTGAFGPDVWLLAALGAPVLTALLAAVIAVRDRSATVPHGPSMCVASLTAAALVLF
ncbi:prepilin peptidase [Mycolicibacterium sarraceniae]|uniref:Prepilin peptidase n=1 Tax=Mycolicibacterium sarraceniae TaxID=1534348 RepID=A0A7I7SYI4_9MYCO|nr:prepilin peptidase [Mycolicibacterium sarraceniae]BBY61361.1 prepilin peptidase [Mycolicibacterium sarraceniae]